MLSLAARFFLGLFLFMLTQVSASANDQITHRAYYEDKGRELTFSEVMQKRFNDYSGILSLGYLKAAVWIHLNIDPHETAKETSLVLRIRPGFLDKIELFDPIYDSLGEVVTGDEQPTRPSSAVRGLIFDFL